MAAQSEVITLECTWCGTQYEKGKESDKTFFGAFKCKGKRPGQEKYHPGKWVRKRGARQHSNHIAASVDSGCDWVLVWLASGVC